MIFKQADRRIRLTNSYTIQELCLRMNRNINSPLRLTCRGRTIFVHKIFFSDFFLFNMSHVASLMVEAKSQLITESPGSIDFKIGMSEFFKVSMVLTIVFWLAVALLSQELIVGALLTLLLFVGFLLQTVLLKYGIMNFTKHWDRYITAEI